MKILVVDDNRFIQEVARSMLEPEGYQVDAADSVDEAIAALEKTHYVLIITDIVMPEKTGYDFMDYLKEREIKIPVLAVTGGLENAVDEYVNFAKLMADRALAKPLVKAELLETIRELTA